jgi:23S rRNA maturation mini-RNase III
VVGSSFEAIIGILYFLRIFTAVKKRQNGIVLAYAAGQG